MQHLHEAGVTIHVTKKTTNTEDALLLGVKQTYAETYERVDDPLDGR